MKPLDCLLAPCYYADMKINIDDLVQEMLVMAPRQRLYEAIKAEMKRRKRWKPWPKGKSFAKGYDPRRGSGYGG